MPTRTRGKLHAQAARFDAELAARQQAAADQMLAAWSQSYQNVLVEIDRFNAKVAAALAAGDPVSPAWAYQKGRLKALLDTTRQEVGRYATDASQAAVAAQAAAVNAAQRESAQLTQTAMTQQGIEATLRTTDPRALIQQAVGFTGDGTVLAEHLAKTLTPETVDGVRATVVKGLALGKGQDWMARELTRNFALAHTRAETIMRTETLRAYREVSRATYEANTDVLEGWTWQAHLDARTCIACAVMDGTLHPVTDTLDGHPRCRCAMLPRTKSWEDLGVPGLADTRPKVPAGRDWIEAQPESVQRAMMGPAKFDAWKRGDITLDDMVAQHHSDDWGTMRTERSLKSITEGRNPNAPTSYAADGTPAPAPSAPPAANLPDAPAPAPAPAPRPTPAPTTPTEPARRFSDSDLADPPGDPMPPKPDPSLAATDFDKYLAQSQALNEWNVRNYEIVWRRKAARHGSVYDGGPKLPPGSVDDALKRSNPKYPGAGTTDEYTTNCYNAVSTYDMRRRGYDVIADPNTDWESGGALTGPELANRWFDPTTGRAPNIIQADLPDTYDLARIRHDLADQIGSAYPSSTDGSWGVVTVTWKGGDGGHTFVWQKGPGGVIEFADPQSGQVFTDTIWGNVEPGSVRFWRTDHLSAPTGEGSTRRKP